VIDNKVPKRIATHPIVNPSSIFGKSSRSAVGAKAVVFIDKQIIPTNNTVVVGQRGVADGNVILDSPLGSSFQLRMFKSAIGGFK
jgi:archaeosine-15-forming tRNA-guanine transglycosylase